MPRLPFLPLFVALATFVLWPRAAQRDAPPPLPQTRPEQRAMLAFSSFDQPNVLHRSGWYAVWCYLPNVKKKTVHHWQQSVSVFDWTRSISQAASTPGREWAVLNGAYFGYDARSGVARQPLIGSAGNGKAGSWSHGSPPGRPARWFQRWAFGFHPEYSGAADFRIGLMQAEPSRLGFWTPREIETEYSHGLSGLLCLLKDGEPMVWRDEKAIHLEPPGQWDGNGEFRHGYYRRAAVAWTSDGRHLFLVVQHNPRDIIETRNLFAEYSVQRETGPGELLPRLHAAFDQLKPQERPCAPEELPQRIENAMLLDGGHSASLMYRRFLGHDARGQAQWEESGSWLTGTPGNLDKPLVPTMIQVEEK